MSARLNNNVLSGLDLWDAPHVRIPERSHLYHLEPIGIGTPDVESFTSYLSRLAAAHNVTLLSLVQKEISPLLPESSSQSRNFQSVLYGPYARALNGLEQVAKHWASTLEVLTLRKDLILLSMSRWCEVFPPVGVIRVERVWCPDCYEEWRAEGKRLFDPLIWFIKPIQICIHHKRALVKRCPHCSKTLPALSSHYRSGYCSKCMNWLGQSENGATSMNNTYQDGEIEWQQWVSKNVGELLALPAEIPPPDKDRIVGVLMLLASKAPRQSMHGFAEWLRVPKNSARYWCTGKSLPRITALLYICRRFDVTLSEFLLKDNIVDDIDISSTHTKIIYEKMIKNNRNEEAIREALEAAITSKELPPPSMLIMAGRLGIDVWDLRNMFPDLSKRISEKFKQYRRECKRTNLNSICEDIRRISLELHSEGIEPTRGRISVRMSKSAYFRKKEVEDALISIRNELGYQNP
jgi:hypothetical protein